MVDDHASRVDLAVSTFAWGFTIGFGMLTVWEAIKQTAAARKPLKSVYIWLVWGEILVCFLIGMLVYLVFCGVFEASLGFLIGLLVLWTLKLHFVIQIIINRINLIATNRRWANRLKWGAAAYILALNISVFCIWIPAQLQVNQTYININRVWDRMTKILYLFIDGGLNYIFIRTVKKRLVNYGIVKYDKLVKFNIKIIFVSLAMDLLILGIMSYPNSFVYTQFHPLAFIVKLRIELSMAKLIRKIAMQKENYNTDSTFELSMTRSGKHAHHDGHGGINCSHRNNKSIAETVLKRPMEVLPKDKVMVRKTVTVENTGSINTQRTSRDSSTFGTDISMAEEGREIGPRVGSLRKKRGQEEDEDRILRRDEGRW